MSEDFGVLSAPVDGVPEPITTADALRQVARRIARGHGPVAIDAERASGYRYSQRAYLVQLRRDDAGTVLIDPIELPDLALINEAIGDAEWIVHAASQDLPCLAEVGLRPKRLFDTELAGRLLGEDRVALGTMVEQHLGVRLEKGHSAVDWSTRPLPHSWLVYAALDVELLGKLRDMLSAALAASGKSEWAAQEFDAVRAAPAPAPREDPWRRTSGIHQLRHRRQLAVVRQLWYARDELAVRRDISAGRILPDAAIIAAARANPRNGADLAAMPEFGGPRQRRQLGHWLTAIEAARALPEEDLPPARRYPDALPPTARWKERDPPAAARLSRARHAIAALSTQHRVLAQNLLAADAVRRLAWQPPRPLDEQAVRDTLRRYGVRPWQIDLTASALTAALHVTVDEAHSPSGLDRTDASHSERSVD